MDEFAQTTLIIKKHWLSIFYFFDVLCLTHSKNWTSSYTVLQGSQLSFAKSQATSSSWVSDNLPFANL